ncbi:MULTISPECIES: DUF504 domain-containing protein [Nitrosopumilus]|uniref:DUF504 domain-containing protein n=1 Tax=Nitrosopumilus piranensis TaxID=1582439 RepID=A0A0C5BWZ7_9ARCH|nr:MULTISPECIES: DUF504 domain-containing protein [Nitrosopumilus]AJM92789.1 hypothetical protein NPIRD3C_1577 [Nitrosopumilus piranensis]KAF6244797.1 DUF504 domain-containing protein [Nitrosopumilus sp. b2]
MVKKGAIEEIFSKAKFADESKSYKIFYRNFEKTVETTLPEFLIQSDNLQTIPISRIKKIKKNNTVLFEKKIARGE